ncbi:MAG: transposase [Treponema sp.]|jgi:transposase|nr:transposase [Treponema sp.]
MAYSIDYKKRAVAYKQEGHTFKQLREAFGIPSETYYQWKENLENGYYEQRIKQERRWKMDKELLRQAVSDKSDLYLGELAEQFGCTATAVFYALEQLDITRKKRPLPIMKNQKSGGRSMPQRQRERP